eukprot:1649615-Prymnesium_polylepis.1
MVEMRALQGGHTRCRQGRSGTSSRLCMQIPHSSSTTADPGVLAAAPCACKGRSRCSMPRSRQSACMSCCSNLHCCSCSKWTVFDASQARTSRATSPVFETLRTASEISGIISR